MSEKNIEKKITWKKLRENVCRFSHFLKELNLKKNDRIAAYVPNTIEAIIAFLATSKNGLIWSSCSPDFGEQGLIDRFFQIKPKVLITCEYYYYNGKKINILDKIPGILKKIKSIKKVVVFPYGNKFEKKINPEYEDFYSVLKKSKVDLFFKKFNFNHPL